MKPLKNIINNNTFIFKNGVVEQIITEKSSGVFKGIEKSIIPLVIITREHYQEVVKDYPVPDKKDVQSIIDNEFDGLKMTQIETKDLTSSKAKLFIFDSVSSAYIESQRCIYIPETLLAGFVVEQELTIVTRLGQTLNLVRKGDTIFSSAGKGVYQNPQLFIAASGAGQTNSTVHLEQAEYFQLLLEQITCLKSSELKMIVRAQVAHKRFMESLHLPSLGLGVLAAVVLYGGLLWGQLKWFDLYPGVDYSPKDVREVIQARQRLEENIKLYNELSTGSSSGSAGEVVWEIVTGLLEADVSVGSIIFKDDELSLVMVAESATAAIELVSKEPSVKSVTLDGDIYAFGDRQAANIVIVLNKEPANV